MTAAHPTERLDDTVHQRVRLGILAVLAEVPKADFTFLRQTLSLTDGNLATHLQVLEAAGYVKITRTTKGRRPKTSVAATAAGRRALEREVEALRELVARIGGPAVKA